MSDFVTALNSRRTLLMDGAMGSEIRAAVKVDCCERLNFERPSVVNAIHRAYVGAGAQVLLTNTFQANRQSLAAFDLADRHHEIWQAAIELARFRSTFTLADVGPIANLPADVASEVWRECRKVDGVLAETWSSIAALKTFANARGRNRTPLLVSFTYRHKSKGGLRTFNDARPEACARAAKECGAIAIGANCGNEIDMADMLEVVKRYHDVCDLPVFVRPNAGTPKRTRGRWVYPRSPEELANVLPALVEEGIAMVGGCCGVGPEYLKLFRKTLAA